VAAGQGDADQRASHESSEVAFDEMSGVKDCLGPNNQGIGRKEAYDQQKLVVITSKGIWLAQIYQNYRPAKA